MKRVTSHVHWLVRTAVPVFALLSLNACDFFRNSDQRTARATQMMAANQYREAIIELRNALQDDPSHVPARLKLAEAELQLGDVAGAEKDLRRALELGAARSANAELIARIRLASGAAKELLEGIESGDVPLQGSALALYRGEALLDLRQFAQARAAFESVPQADVNFARARLGVSRALAANGEVEAALSELDRLVERDPKSFDSLLERGTLRAKRGEFDAAAADLKQARTLASSSVGIIPQARLLASLCEVLLAQGDVKAADDVLRELTVLAPDAMVTHVLMARSAMAAQDYASAVATLQRALVAAPEFTQLRFLLGAALYAQGNLGQAELQLTQALQRAPENLEARKLLAQVQLRLNRPDAALQLLSNLQSASDSSLERILGAAKLQMGEESAGVAHLERAMQSAPGDVNLKLDLARAYLRAGRTADAVKLLNSLDSSQRDTRQVGLIVAAYEAAGDRAAAEREVERLITQRPRDAQALQLASGYFAYRRNFERAREFNQRAIALAPKDVGLLLARASVEARAGNLESAESWLLRAKALDGDSASVHMALARIAALRGDSSAAARALEDLRKRDPASIESRMQLAELYLKTRNSAAAKPVIDELKKLGASRPEVMSALGRLFLGTGRYDEALLCFQAATAQDGSNPVYWLDTARAQLALENNGVAREALGKALAAQPGWLPAVGTLAMLDVREGKAADAVARVNELASQHPRDADVLALQGDVYVVLKDYAKASASYDAAMAVRGSGEIAAKSFKARELGKLANPTAPLEKWLSAHPDEDRLRLLLADAYERAGDRKRAVSQYEQIRSGGRANPVILNNLAWLYYELGDARAESTAREAFEGAPQIAAVADTYGWVLVQNGKASEAVKILERAAAAGNDSSMQYHYAVALLRSGAAEEGRRRLKDLLEKSPDFPEAGEARKLLEVNNTP